jgi:hypothetical protein
MKSAHHTLDLIGGLRPHPLAQLFIPTLHQVI